jgi:hypothetical protein
MLLRRIVLASSALGYYCATHQAHGWMTPQPAAIAVPTSRYQAGRSRGICAATIAPVETSSTVVPAPNGAASTAGEQQPTSWECDEDANCVAIPACDDNECRTSLDVRLHGTWYDLSGWRIDWYDGRDATEVMDGFHSPKGRSMYQRLPKSKENAVAQLQATVVPDTDTQLAFRKLREDLDKEGFWERDMVHEYTQLGLWALCVLGAALTAQAVPFVSICFLSLSMTAAGWLGHDYIHGVDAFADKFRNFAALAAGLSPTWWSDKVRFSVTKFGRVDAALGARSYSCCFHVVLDSTTSITHSRTSRGSTRTLRQIPSCMRGRQIPAKTLPFERSSTTSFGSRSRSCLRCGASIL